MFARIALTAAKSSPQTGTFIQNKDAGFARAGQEAEINAASFPLTPGMVVVEEVKRATRRAITFFLLPLPCFVDKFFERGVRAAYLVLH